MMLHAKRYRGPIDRSRRSDTGPARGPASPGWSSGGGGSLVQAAVLHDDEQRVLTLQALDVGERIAIDEQEVGEVAGLDLAELVRAAHDLATHPGGRDERLHRSEAEHVDEEEEIAGIGAVRVPRESVVAAGQDADAALAHLAHGIHRDLHLVQEATLAGLLGGESPLAGR